MDGNSIKRPRSRNSGRIHEQQIANDNETRVKPEDAEGCSSQDVREEDYPAARCLRRIIVIMK